MKVLLVGSGGREHALAWSLAASAQVKALYAAPGNPGLDGLATRLPLNADDIDALCDWCATNRPDLVVVGPEVPLMLAITDRLRALGITCFGPGAEAALLEGSKHFAKTIMQEAGVPTGAAQTFTQAREATAYAQAQQRPLVIKADGLAAGKGVIIAPDFQAAQAAIAQLSDRAQFGEAGARLLVEDFMTGPEVSLFALCRGQEAELLGLAQDYKKIGEGDRGLNSGGMGSLSPSPLVDKDFAAALMDLSVRPLLEVMARRGTPFSGVLFVGLMLTPDGPRVLEYNVRFGDPECQVLMPLLANDAFELLYAWAHPEATLVKPRLKAKAAVCVVLASRGYPEAYESGQSIDLSAVQEDEERLLFQAGTAWQEGRLVNQGGRVLNAVGVGDDLATAGARAYDLVEQINWPEAYYRRDIGAIKP